MIIQFTRRVVRTTIDKVYAHIHYDAIYREWFYKHSRRLIQFKDLHRGQDCFIIGNGPSLNKLDLKPLVNYHTFGLNKIYLMFNRIDLNLSYHVAVNPLVIEQSKREFKNMPCPSFLSFRAARGKVYDQKRIYYLMDGGAFAFQHDLTKEIHEGHTVTYVAMQLAYYMGFQRVFLIGVDHNFVVAGSPNERQRLAGADPNHFDPNYFSGKEWNLPDLEGSELAYHLAKYHFNKDGRSILDATRDGKLLVFPKVEYDKALSIAKRKNEAIAVSMGRLQS